MYTYRLAPYLEPGYGCMECGIGLVMRAYNETHGDPTSITHLSPGTFEKQGFTFKWGVEQLVEVEVERYHTILQDDPGVRFTFRRVLEAHPVEPGARFTMRFPDAPPGHYLEDLLVREGNGFLLQETVRLECGSAELCEQLAARRPGEASLRALTRPWLTGGTP